MSINVEAFVDKRIDTIPCMHLLNLEELKVAAASFGIHPQNEHLYLRRDGEKIYLRLDLPEAALWGVISAIQKRRHQ